jgi:hypothetical protein
MPLSTYTVFIEPDRETSALTTVVVIIVTFACNKSWTGTNSKIDTMIILLTQNIHNIIMKF